MPQAFPVLNLKYDGKKERIEDYCMEDLELRNYFPSKKIYMKMAV
jgi:thymidylate synthase